MKVFREVYGTLLTGAALAGGFYAFVYLAVLAWRKVGAI